MYLDIEHRITFDYSDFISDSWMELRVEPKHTPYQNLRRFFLAVGPPSKVNSFQDWLGNNVHHFSVPSYHNKIEILARSIVETQSARFDFDQISPAGPETYPLGPNYNFLTFDGPIVDTPELRNLSKKIKHTPDTPVAQIVNELGLLVYNEIEYKPNVTEYHSTVVDALTKKAGVCQDIAQIMIGLLRLRGIPARYVSGYLDVTRKTEDKLAESHAWIEFLSPDQNWVPYDPTNQLFPNEKYAVVAHGRHYDDVPPNKGVFRGAAQETLTATVKTNLTHEPDESDFQETMGSLDVPVYSKIPTRTASVLDDQIADQAQQQQQ